MLGARKPDFDRFRSVLLRSGEPDCVPFYELGIDVRVRSAAWGKSVRTMQDVIDSQVYLGYDYVNSWVRNITYPTNNTQVAADTQGVSRAFQNSQAYAIRTWDDFADYPWPKPEAVDFSPVEETIKILPENMKIICRGGHMLEFVSNLMSVEGLAYALVDMPDLVEALFQRIGEMELFRFRNLASMPGIGALEVSDDLGFKTGLLFSPHTLRQYVFPWYRRFVAVAHSYGIPVILHSCGNLADVMDDLLAIGFNAKHSYEDQILPVTEAKERYGARLAVLGGIDMDFLCRATPDEVRLRVRSTLEKCLPGGGYALGSGNSIADYVPVENYVAMLDEGMRFM